MNPKPYHLSSISSQAKKTLTMMLLVSGVSFLHLACSPLEQENDNTGIAAAPTAQQLADSLAQSGSELRRLDVIDLEGTASLSRTERERVRARIFNLADNHARKYHYNLTELAKHPRNERRNALKEQLSRGHGIDRLPDIIEVIELHLRLAEAGSPPSESRIVWDFGNLRYLN